MTGFLRFLWIQKQISITVFLTTQRSFYLFITNFCLQVIINYVHENQPHPQKITEKKALPVFKKKNKPKLKNLFAYLLPETV